MTNFLFVLAQTTTSQPRSPQQPPPGLLSSPLLLMVLMGLIMYFILFRPQKAEKKRHHQMLSALKKNDRVVTIGGILGTVLSVKDDEVTLKVDESSNTKITFSRSAISRVLAAAPAEAAPNGSSPAKK